MRQDLSLDEYEQGVRRGEIGVLARALTLVESRHPGRQALAEGLLARLLPHTGGAIRVGITGVPGAGKSTFIEALGLLLIRAGRRVAVLAIDPSSEVGGGSILGDKTRMSKLAIQPGAFIRPSPSGGLLGGLAATTRESLLVCEAAGYDIVLVETVGVGQSETIVADVTDHFLSLMLPNAGDDLQAMKRGLLERVNVIVVNKADGPWKAAAELAAQQFRHAVRGTKEPAEVRTCSSLEQTGIEGVWQAITERHARRLESGALRTNRGRQNVCWLWERVDIGLRSAIQNHVAVRALREQLERDVEAGTLAVPQASRAIFHAVGL